LSDLKKRCEDRATTSPILTSFRRARAATTAAVKEDGLTVCAISLLGAMLADLLPVPSTCLMGTDISSVPVLPTSAIGQG